MSTTDEDGLRKSLSYDPSSGLLTWLPGTRFAGRTAGYTTKRGHLIITRTGVTFLAHRVAWFLYYGNWPSKGIDHIDGDPSNNRIENLRDVGQSDNNRNKCLRKDSSTQVTGVSWCKVAKKWRAYINISGKPHRLGYFEDFQAAVDARKAAEPLHGYHPNHGRR